jgi:sialic acid synthase SpsE
MADNEKSERKEQKEQQQQDVELLTWYKKIEMIGMDIKSLDRENETWRLMLRTTFINQHFINELDKIGLQLIKITARGYLYSWIHSVIGTKIYQNVSRIAYSEGLLQKQLI